MAGRSWAHCMEGDPGHRGARPGEIGPGASAIQQSSQGVHLRGSEIRHLHFHSAVSVALAFLPECSSSLADSSFSIMPWALVARKAICSESL
eukprot:3150233-Pyramimonas_sp.AAC.1